MSSETAVPLSEESIEFLTQARQGKVRRFAMMASPSQILSLVVYKKGTVEAKMKEAKKNREGGTGQFFFGVIEGKGANLNFKLAVADGFKKEPCKTGVLRKFLAEHTELKLMPLFEIVAAHGIILDEDDPLVQRFLKLQAAALDVAILDPSRSVEVGRLCETIGKLLSGEDSVSAEPQIAELERLLTTTQTIQQNVATEEQQNANPEKELFKQRLTQLKQDAVALRNGETPAIALLAGRMKAAASAAMKAKFTEALAELDHADQLLLLAREFAAIAPRYADVKHRVPSAAGRLDAIWEFATNSVAAGSYQKTATSLKRLADEMNAAIANAPSDGAAKFGIDAGLVAVRAKFVAGRWQTTLTAVGQEVAQLQSAIAQALPHENAKMITKQVRRTLSKFGSDLTKVLDRAEKRPGEPDAVDEVLRALKKYRQHVLDDPLIGLLQQAESRLGVAIDVRGTLLRGFSEIERGLKS